MFVVMNVVLKVLPVACAAADVYTILVVVLFIWGYISHIVPSLIVNGSLQTSYKGSTLLSLCAHW